MKFFVWETKYMLAGVDGWFLENRPFLPPERLSVLLETRRLEIVTLGVRYFRGIKTYYLKQNSSTAEHYRSQGNQAMVDRFEALAASDTKAAARLDALLAKIESLPLPVQVADYWPKGLASPGKQLLTLSDHARQRTT